MTTFNAFDVEYRLILLPPTGGQLDITDLILSAHYADLEDELAARLTLSIKNVKRADGWIHQHVYLARRMVLEASDGSGWKEVFRGATFRWKSVAGDHTVEFTAYDMLFPMARSKDHFYFSSGATAAGSIKQIASKWGIPTGKIDAPGMALGKKIYTGTIGDTIAQRLKESKEKGAGDYIVRSTQGKLEVVKEGMNSTIYELRDDFVEDSSDQRAVENIITRVKIYGNQNSEERPEVVSTVNGRTEFGVIQDILYKSNFDSAGAANAAAKSIIADKGKVEINRPLISMDIPWIRKGDKVAVASGTIGGAVVNGHQSAVNCIVKSVSRNLETKKMTLHLKG